jgi:hypothetical protein
LVQGYFPRYQQNTWQANNNLRYKNYLQFFIYQ